MKSLHRFLTEKPGDVKGFKQEVERARTRTPQEAARKQREERNAAANKRVAEKEAAARNAAPNRDELAKRKEAKKAAAAKQMSDAEKRSAPTPAPAPQQTNTPAKTPQDNVAGSADRLKSKQAKRAQQDAKQRSKGIKLSNQRKEQQIAHADARESSRLAKEKAAKRKRRIDSFKGIGRTAYSSLKKKDIGGEAGESKSGNLEGSQEIQRGQRS